MKYYLLFFIFLFVFGLHTVHAQKEINNWCFPSDAGMDFNSGNPAIFSCTMNTTYQEGCSSISDVNGNLLFYTDGSVVRDRNNTIMPNGGSLLGSYTASQGALIVQQPGSTSLFYVFTLDFQNGPNGLHYSVVDMNLNGGFGDVSVLNTQLSPGVLFTEKMIGIRHSNNNDIWVITHESFNDAFYSYLVTAGGVDTVPVITHVGQIWAVNNDVGTMHCTLDGSRIAAAYWGSLSGYEVFDFDKSAGTLSNPLYLTDPNYTNAYSVCFSPGGRYLYGGCYNTNQFFQFDLQQPLPVGVLIASTPAAVGDMQIGPDSNIYLVLTGWSYVSAIYDPDSAGMLCNYVQNAVNLNGSTCSIGITNFVYPVYNQMPVALFNAPNHICPGTCTNFNNISLNAISYIWTFPGANPSTSVDINPSGICYNTPGTYAVTLIATNSTGSDTLTLNNFITVYPNPSPQGIAQSGDTLFANTGAIAYQWFFSGNIITGATDYFYVAPQSGNYTVVATDANGCEVEAGIFDVVAAVAPNSLGAESEVSIFPNPVTEKLGVFIPGNAGKWYSGEIKMAIYNVAGEELSSLISIAEFRDKKPGSEIVVDVHQLAKGIYWIELNDGNHIYRNKIIKN